jgi:hypothetical protein
MESQNTFGPLPPYLSPKANQQPPIIFMITRAQQLSSQFPKYLYRRASSSTCFAPGRESASGITFIYPAIRKTHFSHPRAAIHPPARPLLSPRRPRSHQDFQDPPGKGRRAPLRNNDVHDQVLIDGYSLSLVRLLLLRDITWPLASQLRHRERATCLSAIDRRGGAHVNREKSACGPRTHAHTRAYTQTYTQ